MSLLTWYWRYDGSKTLSFWRFATHLSTWTNIPAPPNQQEGIQASVQRESYRTNGQNRILILICPPNAHSCHKYHNHGNTMEMFLQADHQTGHKYCTGGKHNLILIPNSKVVTNAARMENTI